ncbi:uncharacterized protein si:ch73-109i22.2 isoform X2 [Ictalurus punctatus]|uniref:Uncharacterized protein si:ch73-109i22.2 isoform X2 n=1 Tax=Ictalurus punctatus TaxID=7998 RepID=A0A2D0S4Y7_ICTPU|nr:uncharacterized protein si:ch73-109i22.2 isoform X2 [Ictalurus punctatus]
MDFDYQKMKDEESRQREERISSLPALQPRPLPRPSIATETPSAIRKPPIKPRRSIKCRPVTQPGSGESHSQTNQMENEERKRIAPSQVLNPAGPLDAQTPSLQAHNLLWFQRTQLPPWQPKPVSLWRHGFATRREAEQVLQDKQQGCYLLRLSESKVGFVLSYRGEDKCRHFLIEQECDEPGMEGYYIIAGENSRHNSLEGLINYYTHNPVGPFNETLTVPYVQTNDICEDKPKLEERNKAEIGEEKEASPPTSREHTPTAYTGNDVHAAPQYAVVRKVLRKTHSLSECITVSDMLPLVQENTDRGTKTENDTPEHVFGNVDTCVGEDVDHPVDAPYARVNKPQRPAGPSSAAIDVTDANVWGASAASDSQAFLNAPAAAEQKYWELEPMHTYEEALHTRPRDDQIDFCAVGRHRENARDADSLANHVYSEVNIKGTRDDPIPASPPLRTGTAFISTPSSTGPGPRLPLRPARRPVIPSSTQNFGVSAMRNTSPYQPEQALAENSESSIYEQIPERPNRSRPPLPPLNGRR